MEKNPISIRWPLEFQVVLKESIDTPGQWEFGHPGRDSHGLGYPNYTWKLPLDIFPITHNKNKGGIIVNCNNKVEGVFHRYEKSRFGLDHFYIGSPYLSLGKDSSNKWRDFIGEFNLLTGQSLTCKLKIFSNDQFEFSTAIDVPDIK